MKIISCEEFKKLPFKSKLFVIFIILPLFYMIFIPLIKVIGDKLEEKRRYKKVIKKGLFWDTEYLIEKDNIEC